MPIPRPWTRDEDLVLLAVVKEKEKSGRVPIKWTEVSNDLNQKINKHSGRTNKECRKRYLHSLSATIKKTTWTQEEDEMLLEKYRVHGPKWATIARAIPGRTDDACSKRYQETLDPVLNLGKWTHEDDKTLFSLYMEMPRQWRLIGKEMKRPSLKCRHRYESFQRSARRAQGDSLQSSPAGSITNTSVLAIQPQWPLEDEDSALQVRGSDQSSSVPCFYPTCPPTSSSGPSTLALAQVYYDSAHKRQPTPSNGQYLYNYDAGCAGSYGEGNASASSSTDFPVQDEAPSPLWSLAIPPVEAVSEDVSASLHICARGQTLPNVRYELFESSNNWIDYHDLSVPPISTTGLELYLSDPDSSQHQGLGSASDMLDAATVDNTPFSSVVQGAYIHAGASLDPPGTAALIGISASPTNADGNDLTHLDDDCLEHVSGVHTDSNLSDETVIDFTKAGNSENPYLSHTSITSLESPVSSLSSSMSNLDTELSYAPTRVSSATSPDIVSPPCVHNCTPRKRCHASDVIKTVRTPLSKSSTVLPTADASEKLVQRFAFCDTSLGRMQSWRSETVPTTDSMADDGASSLVKIRQWAPASSKQHMKGAKLSRKLAASSDGSVRPYACAVASCWPEDDTVGSACFSSSKELLRHRKERHKDDSTFEPYRCALEGCVSQKYKAINGLEYHIQKSATHYCDAMATVSQSDKDGEDEKEDDQPAPNKHFRCDVRNCTKAYTSLGGLRYHKRHGHTEARQQLDQLPPALARDVRKKTNRLKRRRVD